MKSRRSNKSNTNSPSDAAGATDTVSREAELDQSLGRLNDYWRHVSPRRRFQRRLTAFSLVTCAAVLLGCWQWWNYGGQSGVAKDGGTNDEQQPTTEQREETRTPDDADRAENSNAPSVPQESGNATDQTSPPSGGGRSNTDGSMRPSTDTNDNDSLPKNPDWKRPPRTRREAERRFATIIQRSETHLATAIEHLTEMFDEMTLQIEAQRLAPHRQYVLTRMPSLIADSEGEQRRAAVGLLAELSGPDTVELLAQVIRVDESSRQHLLPKLLSFTDSAVLYQAYVTTHRIDERESVLVELASRRDNTSLELLLRCIAHGVDHEEKLPELLRSRRPDQADELLFYLAAADQQVSWGACVGLASIAEPEHVVALQRMVVQNRHGIMAAAALLMSEHEQARQVVAALGSHPRYTSLLRSAVAAVQRHRRGLATVTPGAGNRGNLRRMQ